MAKTVLLLRHAKSSWADPTLEDFDRPLNPRGSEAAPRMGRYMKDHGLVPDLVLCSTARRALQTWELVAEVLDADCPVEKLRRIYLASPRELLDAVKRCPDEADCVLMIGHNPGLEQLAAHLSGQESKSKALAGLNEKYPTGALAEIQFDVDRWADLKVNGGRLTRFVIPRQL